MENPQWIQDKESDNITIKRMEDFGPLGKPAREFKNLDTNGETATM